MIDLHNAFGEFCQDFELAAQLTPKDIELNMAHPAAPECPSLHRNNAPASSAETIFLHPARCHLPLDVAQRFLRGCDFLLSLLSRQLFVQNQLYAAPYGLEQSQALVVA